MSERNDLARIERRFDTETERDDSLKLFIRVTKDRSWIMLSEGELERLTMAVSYLNRQQKAFDDQQRDWQAHDRHINAIVEDDEPYVVCLYAPINGRFCGRRYTDSTTNFEDVTCPACLKSLQPTKDH